jgi:SSS family transporter
MGFHWIDWAVLAVYLAGTSWLADRLAGSRQTVRDFFLGGRRLPWWAVCGSIVASEVSGATFVAVPAITFAEKGDFTFMMLALGTVAARFVIARVFVPSYYRQEIYSPYEFLGRRLGPGVDRVTTGMFFVGAFLAQGARLFLAALVLNTIVPIGIVWCIAVIGAVSVVWTWIGGINSVVWTDVVQFVVLFVGGIVALVAAAWAVPGGLLDGVPPGKFRFLEFTPDPRVAYTFWAGLFGYGCLTLASHGTDQIMAQRIFCCRSEADARKAVIWSGLSQLLPLLMLGVGVGIYAYYRKVAPTPEEARLLAERNDYAFPLFILRAMPVGVKGLLFAAIFSAATATSTLAAMAQTALTGFYRPLVRREAGEAHYVFVGRLFVLAAALGLCGIAVLCDGIRQYKGLLDMALAMAGYTYGAMLGILLLALLPAGRDARGLFWGVPASMALVFALAWNHLPWARHASGALACALALGALLFLSREPAALLAAWAGAALVAGAAYGLSVKVAWPWHFPIGTLVTLGLGWAIGRKKGVAAPAGTPVS